MGETNTPLIRSLNDPLDEIVDELLKGDYKLLHLTDVEGLIGSDSFLKVAHSDASVKDLAVTLAKKGYYVYWVVENVIRFVREDHIPHLWHLVTNGTYQSSEDGLVYSVQKPLAGGLPQNLVVVFSSISEDIFGNGLSRFFTQNYKSITKFLPDDTAIMRIADIGGVVGSFYLNTEYAPHNTQRILSLIESVRHSFGLTKSAVITYGASKGATGAFYHALHGGYKCVCVEPIVNDEYYETAYSDSHFTADGIFLQTKEEVFEDALNEAVQSNSSAKVADKVILYSAQSPQSLYIEKTIGARLPSTVSLVNVRHPGIADHPDVSPKSLNLVSMYLNMMCYDLAIEPGQHYYSCIGPEY